MPRPLVFISHKHADRAIASVLRGFIKEQTVGKTPVFQSSDPTAVTPRVGRDLNADLRSALWDAGAVLLVYTSPDQDWGYCMWECGVATVPDSPDTRIVLLQCGDTAPSLFDGQLLVNARDRISVATFVTQFMTQPDFLPRSGEPLTGYHKESKEVAQAAERLFTDLHAVLPEGTVADRAEHPFIQLQLPSVVAKSIADAPAENRSSLARTAAMAEASVSHSDADAAALFGLVELAPSTTLRFLADTWRAASPGHSDSWVDGVADQVARAAQGQLPALRWTALASVRDGRQYVPVLARVRKIPASALLQFDVYFYPFSLADATPVHGAMRQRADMFCRVFEVGSEDQVKLVDLLRDLESHKHGRMPFLDAGDRLVYIVHRSMLDQFVARQVIQGSSMDLGRLTLADLFRDQPQMKVMFAETAAFVGRQQTLADAKAAMSRVPNSYDVFVTETGQPDEPVIGWLTDVKIATAEAR